MTYELDGYTVVPAVLGDDEVAACRDECDRLWSRPELVDPDGIRGRSRPTLDGPPIVDRLDPVIDVSPLFARLAVDDRLVALAAGVLGEPVALLKDKLITKPPRTGGYGLHQDHMRWQAVAPPDAITTVGVAIDDMPAASGPVEVYAGQHDRLLTPPGVVADPTDDDVDPARRRAVELAAGDALLFHPLLPHRSDANRSRSPRRVLYLTYARASLGDLYDDYLERHRAAMRAERRARA